jgi:DNA-binding NtrC family response regulator
MAITLDKILIVEDDPIVRNLLSDIFKRHKCGVCCAQSIAEAENLLATDQYDLMLLDLRLPDGDGHRFLERVVSFPQHPLVVMVTGYGTIESAVACMRAGAFDYVLKPFSPGQIDIILKKAQAYSQLLQVNRYLSNPDGAEEGGLIGRSPSLLRLRQMIGRVAPTDATVLITGESGTGKEMIAREIYRASPRRQQPFIKVNCAAISQNLIESEFFGHERGAFTGATERREGRFELANQGTLLLDEVSEIPLNLQAKLLRVLQEREFERVGGNRTIKVNVRLLATSNRDLLSHVEKGEFRQDLYYRLNVFPVHVPALRERGDDVNLLADHFLKRCARKHGIKINGFADSARAALTGYRWPGNVREMQNTIERAVILTGAGRPLTASALGLSGDFSLPSGPASVEPPNDYAAALVSAGATTDGVTLTDEAGGVRTIAELEKQAIAVALRQSEGNRTQAAQLLGISIRTLRNKLQEYRAAGDPVDAELGTGTG